MKADIDSSVEYMTRKSTKVKPTLATNTEIKTDATVATQPSEPTTQTPSSGSDAASKTVDVESANIMNTTGEASPTETGLADDKVSLVLGRV